MNNVLDSLFLDIKINDSRSFHEVAAKSSPGFYYHWSIINFKVQ